MLSNRFYTEKSLNVLGNEEPLRAPSFQTMKFAIILVTLQ